MQRLNEHRVRLRLGRTLGRAAAVLLFATALCQSDLAHAGPHVGAAVFTEVVASMAAAFTPARFTVVLADFMVAEGTVASGASTMVSATATAATGTTAGEANDTAGGGVAGWGG